MQSNKERAADTAPKEQHLLQPYWSSQQMSMFFVPLTGKTQVKQAQEILGWILLSLQWPSVDDNERTILLHYVESLLRRLIDLRRESGNKTGS